MPDIKEYLVKFTKAEYDERRSAEAATERAQYQASKKFKKQVQASVDEEQCDREREQARIRKQRQWERETEREIEAGLREPDGTLKNSKKVNKRF